MAAARSPSLPNNIMTNYHMLLLGKGGGKLAGNRHVRIPTRKVTS